MKKSKLFILTTLFLLCLSCFGIVACGEDTPTAVNPTIIVNSGENYLVTYGDTFILPKISIKDDDVDTVTHTIKVTNGDDELPIVNNSFVANKLGTNVITITATDKDGNTVTKQLKVGVTNEGELNPFNSADQIACVKGKGATKLSLNTNTDFVREGNGSLKVEVQKTSSKSWPGIVVNNLPETYLLNDYSISFWVFNDGTKDVEIYLNRNESSPRAKFLVPAKIWTKIEVTARNYDRVFTAIKGTANEPEVGPCDDIKCITFHFVNPANTPTFNLYVDNLSLNPEKVIDTLELKTVVPHPVVNQAYVMPEVVSYFNNQVVDADVTYDVYDKNFNKLTVTNNTCTFTQKGKYTLIINSNYGTCSGAKSVMLICAENREENEVEFFEDEVCLNFFESSFFNISLSTKEKHNENGSTASLKFHSNPSVWPYATMKNLPHADLVDVRYICFYAKTDYPLTSSQTAYLGLRDAGRAEVVKRWTLSNEWTAYVLRADELSNLGITTLNGLQFSVELKDPSNPNNVGTWCPIAFDTYIDNFSVGLKKDFPANETLDDFSIFTPTNTLYQVSVNKDTNFIVEGNTSLKFSATQKWPSWTFSSDFVDWLATKEYQTVSFKIYFDGNSPATLNTSWGIHSLAGTNPEQNAWLDVTINVSDITKDTEVFSLNKNETKDFNVYIDDIQFN